jgi:hypothetical protein
MWRRGVADADRQGKLLWMSDSYAHTCMYVFRVSSYAYLFIYAQIYRVSRSVAIGWHK